MDADVAKIRVKMGAIEIEYEGKASFLESGLQNILNGLAAFHSNHQEIITSRDVEQTPNGEALERTASGLSLEMSTNSLAAHLGASKGSELIIAAAAHLTFVAKRDTFTRQELLDEMKSATTYFTPNVRSNLSSMLDNLQKAKRLNQPRTGVFALGANERTSLEARLAGIG